MKIRKKHVVIGLIVLFGSLSIGCGLRAIAKGRGCEGRFPSGFHGRGFHFGHPGKHSPERVLSFLDKRIEFLDLNESQKEKYEEVRGKIKDRLTEHMEDRKAFAEQLREETDHENPDINRIADLLRDRIQSMSSSLDEGLTYFVEFYNVLDENQKKLVIERFRNRAHCRSWKGGEVDEKKDQ